MHLAQALQVSLHLKLPVLSYILLKRKFIRQASRQCQRALDPHTDWLTRCHCLFVAWLHRKCYCDSDSTLEKLPPFNSHVVGQNAAPHCRIPGKALNFFFLLNQPLPAVWALETWWQQRCLREQVSQRWNPEVRSRSYNRDTGAVLVQRAVRIPHVEREVQRRKNKLGTGALRTFAWINCAEPGLIFFFTVDSISYVRNFEQLPTQARLR